MDNFHMGDLADWVQVAAGELVDFEIAEGNSYRSIAADVICDEPVAAYAVGPERRVLVARGSGLMNIRFTSSERFALLFLGDAEADIFVRTRLRPQVVGDDGSVTFTTIEPRSSSSSQDAEFKRMMKLMQLNQERREAALLAGFEARLAQAQSAPVAPAVEPVGDVIDGGDNDVAE